MCTMKNSLNMIFVFHYVNDFLSGIHAIGLIKAVEFRRDMSLPRSSYYRIVLSNNFDQNN